MTLKDNKYLIFDKMLKFFFVEKNNIFLFVHSNSASILDNKIISQYCSSQNIQILNVKASYYKKILKNMKFLKLFSGPTKVFIFKNFISLIYFLKHDYIKKNIIPLSILWQDNFFNYLNFYQNISTIYEKNVQIFADPLFFKNNFRFNNVNYIFNFVRILNINLFSQNQVNLENRFIDILLI